MDKKSTDDLFNHEKALKTSHSDHGIALKLRLMFIKDLPSQLAKAESLWQAKDYETLQSQLHHILGGAQVCAADGLIDCVNQVKLELKSGEVDKDRINQIWLEIKAINSAMQVGLKDTENS